MGLYGFNGFKGLKGFKSLKRFKGMYGDLHGSKGIYRGFRVFKGISRELTLSAPGFWILGPQIYFGFGAFSDPHIK